MTAPAADPAIGPDRRMFAHDFAVRHIQLPRAAARGGIVQHHAPEGGLRHAAAPLHLDDVIQRILPARRADYPERLVRGIGGRQQRERGQAEKRKNRESDFHRLWTNGILGRKHAVETAAFPAAFAAVPREMIRRYRLRFCSNGLSRR